MDVVSVVASVVALASLTGKLSHKLIQLCHDVKEAENETEEVANNVYLLSGVLEHLATTLKRDQTLYRPELSQAVQTLTSRCTVVIADVEKLTGARDEKTSRKVLRKSLAWRFKKRRISLLLANLESLKSALNILLHLIVLTRLSTKAEDGSRTNSSGVDTKELESERRNLVALVLDSAATVEHLKQLETDEKDRVQELHITHVRAPTVNAIEGPESEELSFFRKLRNANGNKVTDEVDEPETVYANGSAGVEAASRPSRKREKTSKERASSTRLATVCSGTEVTEKDLSDVDVASDETDSRSSVQSLGSQQSLEEIGEEKLGTFLYDPPSSELVLSVVPFSPRSVPKLLEGPPSARNDANKTVDSLMESYTYFKRRRIDAPRPPSPPESASAYFSQSPSPAPSRKDGDYYYSSRSAADPGQYKPYYSTPFYTPPPAPIPPAPPPIYPPYNLAGQGYATTPGPTPCYPAATDIPPPASVPFANIPPPTMPPAGYEYVAGQGSQRRGRKNRVKAYELERSDDSSSDSSHIRSWRARRRDRRSRGNLSKKERTRLDWTREMLELLQKGTSNLPSEHKTGQKVPTGSKVEDSSEEKADDETSAFPVKVKSEVKAHKFTGFPRPTQPITLKDPAGRSFMLPVEACKPWQAMQALIMSSVSHSDDIVSHIESGNYDIVGPSGDIILPEVWEAIIKPGWIIELRLRPPASAGSTASTANALDDVLTWKESPARRVEESDKASRTSQSSGASFMSWLGFKR